MFLQPKKFKFKKVKKGKLSRMDFKANKLRFGSYGLKAVESGIIRSRQIEAARQAISRKIRKKGKVWIRIFPDLPVTARSNESRMGKGKGAVSHWVARVKRGTVLFEIECNDNSLVSNAFRTGSAKLPIKTKYFTR